jgi:hypothetical protein
MNATQFETFWHATYPETEPISFQFKHAYPNRWFRIHSLPHSQRYAASEIEWKILLNRQNYLLTDLLGNHADVLLVTGEYAFDEVTFSEDAAGVLSSFSFTPTGRLDLAQLFPTEYEPGHYYQPRFSAQLWQAKQFDPLLREIANGQTNAFFVSQHAACLVAPYDGGVDVILKNEATRDSYRARYRAWLSPLPSGL